MSFTKSSLALAILLLTGCEFQSESTSKDEDASPANPTEHLAENQNIANKELENGGLKISLHSKMLNFLETLVADESFAYLNNDTGAVESLYIVKHHPEIFIHENKDSFVLCVSAKNMGGDLIPVDVYIKRGAGDQLFIYDMRVGEKDRKILMGLMEKSVFNRL